MPAICSFRHPDDKQLQIKTTTIKMQNQRERFKLNLDPAEIDALSPEELKQKVPNQADEALKLRLKKYGMKQCKVESKNFADCSKDKLLSIAVKCKDELQALTDCITI